jgi:hypothetical protein
MLRRIFGPKRDKVTGEWRNLRGRDHLDDPGVDGRIILRWIFGTWDVGHGLDQAGSGEGQVDGIGECGNEHSGSIKCGEFRN